MFGKIINLKKLYKKIPYIPCSRCGSCCTEVSMSMVEFVYLFQYIKKKFTEQDIIRIMMKTQDLKEKRCPLLSQGNTSLCIAYEARPFYCRLYGIPIKGNPFSSHCKRKKLNLVYPLILKEQYQAWRKRILEINNNLTLFPYLQGGLKMDEWLSLYFEDEVKNPHLKAIQTRLQNSIDLRFLKGHFTDRTNFSHTFNSIILIRHLLANNRQDEAKRMFMELLERLKAAFFQEKKFHQATLEIARLTNIFAGTELSGFAQFQLALCAQALEDWDDVVLKLQSFIEYNPNHPKTPEAYYRLGYVFENKLKAFGMAVGAYYKLIHNFPTTTFSRYAQRKIDRMKQSVSARKI